MARCCLILGNTTTNPTNTGRPLPPFWENLACNRQKPIAVEEVSIFPVKPLEDGANEMPC